MRVGSLVVLCALAGCNFRIDPLLGGSGGGGGGSDGAVIIGGDLGDLGPADDLAHRGPFLELAAVPSASSVDLTADGNADWAHWGYSSASDFDHKATGNGQISNFQQVGINAPTQYGDGLVIYRWSDGASGNGQHASTTTNGTTTGIYILSGGFKITAPADTTVRRLKFYVGQLDAEGQLDAALSDNSAPAVSDHSYPSTGGTPINVTYELTYAATSPGQLLTVTWNVVSTQPFGNITMQSASLQAPVF
ncbi:MAG TPA: hypothetical protein VGL86_03085 [Polyangia bacterium]